MLSTPTVFEAGPRLEQLPRGLMYAALCVTVVMQYVYVFTFNPVPDLRLLFAGTLTIFHATLAGVTIVLRPATWNLVLLVSAALTIVTWIPAHFLNLGAGLSFDPAAALRVLVLPLMLIWILAYPLALPPTLLRWCAILFTLLGAVIALTGDPVYAGGTPRLASITGGLDQMHPSAKFMALQLILLDLLRRGDLMSSRLSWTLILLCAGVLLGYGGRNEAILVVVYYSVLAYYRMHNSAIIRWLPPILLGLCIVAAVVVLRIGIDSYGWSTVGDWGSGRIGVWAYRIQLIFARDWTSFTFGGGLGADIVWTPQWWWIDDGLTAHNDYLHVTMEGGIVGLLCAALTLWGIWLRVEMRGKAIVLGVMANSFFANGFFQSPLLTMNLSIVLAVSMFIRLTAGDGDLLAAAPPFEERTERAEFAPGAQ